MEIPEVNSTFAELSNFIQEGYIEKKVRCFYSRRLWVAIKDNPFTIQGIEAVKKSGWKMYLYQHESGNIGICDFDKKELWISSDLDAYSTDNTICHELVHAYYGIISTDGTNVFRLSDKEFLIALRNRAIVEHTARKIRATPSLLAIIWKTFNIPPKIYDRVSLLATQQSEKPQLLFPSFNQDYNFTLID
jgi:hypothetical protein